MADEIREEVHSILENLKGIEPLKELFWRQLSYERVNSPLSRKGWTSPQREPLAENPILWAVGGADDTFHVIYCRLADTRLKRTLERPVVERLLRDHPYALFVFSNDARSDWHFLNVKYDDRIERRRLFRRITVGPTERLRTAADRIAMLDLEDISPDLFGLSPLAIQQRHDEAFDVEKVQKDFFRTLQAIYEEILVPDILKGLKDENKAREAGLILLNRLIFLYFIQKKGWLRGVRGKNHETLKSEFLLHAFLSHREKPKSCSYYSEFICRLFDALARPKQDRMYDYMRGFRQIPFLNGGLFEPNSLASSSDLHVTNATFVCLFDELLERFNFTVTEDTPLDVEVAVDPEMLGKIFEELVTSRHDTGAYYTPRPIVSFMSKEALKSYLGSGKAIKVFIEEHNASGLKNPEAVLEKLRDIKVCDPACGSGAYLVGMLQELIALRNALFAAHKVDSRTDYQRKLDIVQNNLYGVDIDPIAVNIARLRLWLTLCVEYETQDDDDPPPLPNLDFKIERGDSITGPYPHCVQTDAFTYEMIESLEALKKKYTCENVYGDKNTLKNRIDALRKEIGEIMHPDEKVAGFDWSVEIAEVMTSRDNPGFDVILANPPYVRHGLIRPIKPQLKVLYPEVYTGTADLFTFFFARGMELLRQGGQLVFICSSTWTKTAAAAKLRYFLRDHTTVHRFLDFGDLPVFEKGTTYPAIIIAEKTKPPEDHFIRAHQINSILHSEMEKELHAPGILVPQCELEGGGWRFEDHRVTRLLQKIKDAGVTLKDIMNGQIYRGIVTGLNKAFVIDQRMRDALVADDPRSDEILKPFLEGKDFKPWRADWRGLWLIRIPAGWTNRTARKRFSSEKEAFSFFKKQYAAIADWLSNFVVKARKRCDQGDWYWELRPCAYYSEFDKPKIMYPDISSKPKFVYDEIGLYFANTTYFLPNAERYLQGMLSNYLMWWYISKTCVALRGGLWRYRLFSQYIELLPIAQSGKGDDQKITALAEALSVKDCPNRLELEAELNDRVTTLYGLTAEERKIIEQTVNEAKQCQ